MNVELLKAAVDRMRRDPASWDQDSFSLTTECGTTFCLAGHVLMAAGAEYLPPTCWSPPHHGTFRLNGGIVVGVDVVAQGLLDVDDVQTIALFFSGFSLDLGTFIKHVETVTGVDLGEQS